MCFGPQWRPTTGAVRQTAQVPWCSRPEPHWGCDVHVAHPTVRTPLQGLPPASITAQLNCGWCCYSILLARRLGSGTSWRGRLGCAELRLNAYSANIVKLPGPKGT
jgi:hypothetical protein